MRRSRLVVLLALVSMVSMVGCGGGGSSSSPPPAPGGSAPLSVVVRDTPPAGVTVLSFEVTVTGAALQPGNVSLVTAPIKIEVKHLEVEAALLSTLNVPAGTYTSLSVTLANPELTIKNDTGSALAGCAAGAVCEIKPAVSGTVTYSGAPFPITIAANTPIGLLVDVNLNDIIQSNLSVSFSAANAIVVSQLPALQGTGQLEEIEDLDGIVANKDATNSQFTLQTTAGNFTVKVDATTEFEDFDEAGCSTANFACVQNGQFVEVDLRLIAGGVLLAREVELEDDAADDELEGIVFSIDSPTQFKMVILEELRDVPGIEIGNPVTVTLASNPAFRVDVDGLSAPPALQGSFEGAVDTSQLLAGQSVQVRRLGTSSGTTVNTDRVRLRMSRFTATVASVAVPNFIVNGLPSLFTSAGVSQIQVQTSPQTEFEGVSGVSSLASGNTVSLRGLLFKTGADPVMVAKKVRKR